MLLQIKKLLQTEEEMHLWLIIPVKSLKKIQPGIRTHDLCDTDAELYQLSYQAIRELVTLRVRNIPVEDQS